MQQYGNSQNSVSLKELNLYCWIWNSTYYHYTKSKLVNEKQKYYVGQKQSKEQLTRKNRENWSKVKNKEQPQWQNHYKSIME